MTTAIEGLREISSVLELHGIEDAGKETEIILDHLGIGRLALYRDNPVLSEPQMNALRKAAERRLRREPLQYIIGHVDFCGIRVMVGPGVLIPRPETELLVEEAVKTVTRNTLHVTTGDHPLRILDLCTGSGCVALAIAKNCKNCAVVGIDLSDAALGYAEENAKMNNIDNVTFMKGDLYEPVGGSRFDLIVSNPPYIRRGDLEQLPAEIKDWEPAEALDGGHDGLGFYRTMLPQSANHLSEGGRLIVEIGQGEAEDIIGIARATSLRFISLKKDYSGIERIILFGI